jgi:GNAT superfamily N-acetyltransferase
MLTGMIEKKDIEKFDGVLPPILMDRFQSRLPFTVIGLVDEETAAGVLAGCLTEPHVFRIMHLFVHPDHRRKGGGSLLMDSLFQILDHPESTVEFSFLAKEGDSESDSIGAFLQNYGFTKKEDGPRLFRIPLKSFLDSGSFPPGFQSSKIKNIRTLTNREKGVLQSDFGAIDNGLRSEKLSKLISNDSLTQICIEKDRLMGCMTAGISGNRELMVIEYFAPDVGSKVRVGVFKAFIEACRNHLPGGSILMLPAADETYDRMMTRLKGAKNLQSNYVKTVGETIS